MILLSPLWPLPDLQASSPQCSDRKEDKPGIDHACTGVPLFSRNLHGSAERILRAGYARNEDLFLQFEPSKFATSFPLTRDVPLPRNIARTTSDPRAAVVTANALLVLAGPAP